MTDYVENDTRTLITLLILRGKTTAIPVEEGAENLQIDNTMWHYTAISNFNGLMRYDNSTERHCMRCLHTFAGANADRLLSEHTPNCNGIQEGRTQKIIMPTPGKDDKLEFTAYNKAIMAPYAIYLDFESTLEKFV